MFKAIGGAAYKAATKTGLAAGTEQPPYPCATPLRVIDDPNDTETIQALADEIFVAAKDLLGDDGKLRREAIESGRVNPNDKKGRSAVWNPDTEWKSVGFKDPDADGDLNLMSKPHIGTFNFAKATMTFRNCTTSHIIATIHGDDFETRKKFSADLSCFKVLACPTPTTSIQYFEYHAPPPVASRHLIYLYESRYVPEDDVTFVYGCSIDYPPYNKHVGKKTVRAICLWCWELLQVGNDVLTTYSSCMSPNGWAPTFIVGWMKSEIGKELVSIRRVMYGEEKLLQRDGQRDHLARVAAANAPQSEDGEEDGRDTTACGSSKQKNAKALAPRHSTAIRLPMATGGQRGVGVGAGAGGSSGARFEEGCGFIGESISRGDTVQWEDEQPQQEEELAWRELEESEELLLF